MNLIKLYKKKKDDFINRKIIEWNKKLIDAKKRKQNIAIDLNKYFNKAKKDIQKFTTSKGKISVDRLRLEYRLSFGNTNALKRLLEEELV